MSNTKLEIESLIPAFRAVLMEETLRHRNSGGAGSVVAFEKSISEHQRRYAVKLDGIRSRLSDSDDAVRDLADNAEQQIGVVAAEAIERAKAAGKVEIA